MAPQRMDGSGGRPRRQALSKSEQRGQAVGRRSDREAGLACC
jgi:hypothetical protein